MKIFDRLDDIDARGFPDGVGDWLIVALVGASLAGGGYLFLVLALSL